MHYFNRLKIREARYGVYQIWSETYTLSASFTHKALPNPGLLKILTEEARGSMANLSKRTKNDPRLKETLRNALAVLSSPDLAIIYMVAVFFVEEQKICEFFHEMSEEEALSIKDETLEQVNLSSVENKDIPLYQSIYENEKTQEILHKILKEHYYKAQEQKKKK